MTTNLTGEHRPPLLPDVRVCLIEQYRHDILTLERLINLDLSHWLAMPPEVLHAGGAEVVREDQAGLV